MKTFASFGTFFPKFTGYAILLNYNFEGNRNVIKGRGFNGNVYFLLMFSVISFIEGDTL